MHVHVGLNKKSLKILYSMQVTYTYIHVLFTHSEALVSHKTIIDIKIDIYPATSDRIK